MENRRLITMLLMLLAMLIVMLSFTSIQQKKASKKAVEISETYTTYDPDPMSGLNIYTYGNDLDGKMIPFQGGPLWLIHEEHGCAACHGENGRGKKDVEGVDMSPPNIAKLIKGGGPISYEEFADIVKSGAGADGRSLSMDMPRYSMPDNYLRDLYEYIQGF